MKKRLHRSMRELIKLGSPLFRRLSYRPSWRQVRDWLRLNNTENLSDTDLYLHSWSYARSTLGNNRCHQRAVQEAFAKNSTSVMILEDDFHISGGLDFINFYRATKDAITSLENQKIPWNIFMLGHNANAPKTILPDQQSLALIHAATGAQAYIVHNRAFKKILSDAKKGIRFAMDTYYMHAFQARGSVFSFSQSKVSQYPGYSVIDDQYRNPEVTFGGETVDKPSV